MSSFPRRNASAVLRDDSRAKWKNVCGHAEDKKTLFAAAPLVTRTRRSGHRRRNRNPSLRFRLRDGRRDASFFKRGKRETVRGDARVDVRVFFFHSDPGFFFSRHARVSRRRHARRMAVVGASFDVSAPCVRPRARSRVRHLRRRNTPAQKIVLEQVFFTNRSLEASWVNSVRSSPRRVVVSAPFKDRRASRTKMKNPHRRVRESRVRAPPPTDRREGARGDERAASPPSPPPARAPPPPPCGRK